MGKMVCEISQHSFEANQRVVAVVTVTDNGEWHPRRLPSQCPTRGEKILLPAKKHSGFDCELHFTYGTLSAFRGLRIYLVCAHPGAIDPSPSIDRARRGVVSHRELSR